MTSSDVLLHLAIMDTENNDHSISNEVTPPQPQKKESIIKETLKFAAVTLLLVVPVRLYVAQPFIVNGASMDPTFAHGQYLIVDELSYRFSEPERGDVVVFRFPDDQKKFFIKRIIGLPRETVLLEGNAVGIENEKNPQGFTLNEWYLNGAQTLDNRRVVLNEDEYFVMGDNRNQSYDSRSWGPVLRPLIVGRTFLRLFPIDTIAVFPGQNNRPVPK